MIQPLWRTVWRFLKKLKIELPEARRTRILQAAEQNPHSQKDRQDEKAEGYVPDEGTRKNPRKTTK